MKKLSIHFLDSKYRFTVDHYGYRNDQPAIRLYDKDTGEQCITLTCCLINENLSLGEFFVKTWSENKGLAQRCMESGLFVDTGKRIKSGYVHVQVWKLADGLILA